MAEDFLNMLQNMLINFGGGYVSKDPEWGTKRMRLLEELEDSKSQREYYNTLMKMKKLEMEKFMKGDTTLGELTKTTPEMATKTGFDVYAGTPEEFGQGVTGQQPFEWQAPTGRTKTTLDIEKAKGLPITDVIRGTKALGEIEELGKPPEPKFFHGPPGTQFIRVSPDGTKEVIHTIPKEKEPERTRTISPADLQTHYDIDPNVAASAARAWNTGNIEAYKEFMQNIKPKTKEAKEERAPTSVMEFNEWKKVSGNEAKTYADYRKWEATLKPEKTQGLTPYQEEVKGEKDLVKVEKAKAKASIILFGDPNKPLAKGLIRSDYLDIPLTDKEKAAVKKKYDSFKKLWPEDVLKYVDEVLKEAGVLESEVKQSEAIDFKTPSEVKAAYKAGKISKEKALNILNKKFGMK